jgi:hypothetical protein
VGLVRKGKSGLDTSTGETASLGLNVDSFACSSVASVEDRKGHVEPQSCIRLPTTKAVSQQWRVVEATSDEESAKIVSENWTSECHCGAGSAGAKTSLTFA